jgi:type II secretory pathway pseudopilin PulG
MVKMIRRRKRKNQGLTIFEVMIAVALFAIIVTPIMRSFVTSIKINEKARKVMIATDVAQTIMEGFAGKTYEQVWRALGTSESGFNFSSTGNGALAFSSINQNYFNNGHTVHLENSDVDTAFPSMITYDKDSPHGYKINSAYAAIPYDKLIASVAVRKLRAEIAAQTPKMPNMDNPNATDHPYEVDDVKTPATSDKRIYYGGSPETYAAKGSYAPVPKLAYMVYNRVQKDRYFFDVVVTFTPQPVNGGKDALGNDWKDATSGDIKPDDYFSYKVTLYVYEYMYEGNDPASGEFYGLSTTGAWPTRFSEIAVGGETVNVFEGSPLAVMETGIQYQ